MIYLVVRPDGSAQSIYQESISLRPLGALSIRRASHVEPIEDGRWITDLSISGGPVLGPFETKSQALEIEVEWLRTRWLHDN